MNEPVYIPDKGEVLIKQFRDYGAKTRAVSLENDEIKLSTWRTDTSTGGEWVAEYGGGIPSETVAKLIPALLRDKVRVTKSRQEVTFDFRDEVCDVWTFRAGGFNVVHYIEPPSDPIVGSSIRVEEFEKAEDLQVCLAAAIAFRDERRREVSNE